MRRPLQKPPPFPLAAPLRKITHPQLRKKLIKRLLIEFLTHASPLILPHLSESISIITEHEFPDQWDHFFYDVCSDLPNAYNSQYFRTAYAILSALNVVCSNFRHSNNENSVYNSQYCVSDFLVRVFADISNFISQKVSLPPDTQLLQVFELQMLCCEIFRSVQTKRLSCNLRYDLKEWMDSLLTCLGTSFSPEVEAEGTADKLRSILIQTFQFYFENDVYGLFVVYLDSFIKNLFTLFSSSSSGSSPSRYDLTVTAVKFLTSLSTGAHHGHLGIQDFIHQIFHRIVYPNINISEEDEKLLQTNCIEYVRRDIEGRDADPKWRIALELLKGVAFHHRGLVVDVVERHFDDSLNLYHSNPAEHWKKKACNINLVIALASEGDTGLGYLVDVHKFYANYIAPELELEPQEAGTFPFPIIRAAALKFLTVFPEQIPRTEVLRHLTCMGKHLMSESELVQSYAANCYVELWALNSKMHMSCSNDVASPPCYIAPAIDAVLNHLFTALRLPISQDNPYIMKSIAKVLGACDITDRACRICLFELSKAHAMFCLNHMNSIFSHYLFEATGALIERSGHQKSHICKCIARSLLAHLHISVDSDRNLAGVVDISCIFIAMREIGLGFCVLNAVVENIGYDALAQCSINLCSIFADCLQTRQTNKLAKSLVMFLSRVLIKHGPNSPEQLIDSVQKGIFCKMLDLLWIPNLKLITGPTEVKLASVAATRLICVSPVLLDPSNCELWAKMLDSIVTLLIQPSEERVEEDDDELELLAIMHCAGQKQVDPLKAIDDPKHVLVADLAKLSAQNPGHFPLLIQDYVSPSNQAALLQLCSIYNCVVA